MRPHVVQIWLAFNGELEGRFPHLYIDRRRLVTTGVGNLCEPEQLALRLPWMLGDRRATIEEVLADWHTINGLEDKLWNTVAAHQAQYTRVRLTEAAIDALVLRQLMANIEYAREHYLPMWDSLPSDAQLALASAMWALGAGLDKTRPALVRNANQGNWLACKHHAHLEEQGNPGVAPRNRRQEICFENAQTVKERGLDPSWLWWPNSTPRDVDLKTLATRALELGIARGSEPENAS